MSGLIWSQIHWPNPTSSDQVIELLHRLAVEHGRPPLVLEAIGEDGVVRHRIGTEAGQAGGTRHLVHALVPGSILSRDLPRPTPDVALRMHVRHPELGFQQNATSLSRLILTALAATQAGESLTLQVAIARGWPPRATPKKPIDPSQSFFSELLLGPRPATSEQATALRKRASEPRVELAIRLAACAESPTRAAALLRGLTSAMHTAEGASSRFYFTGADLHRLDEVPDSGRIQFTVSEAAGIFGIPLDANRLPGVPAPHPKLLRPETPPATTRVFGQTTAPGPTVPIGLGIDSARQHLVITGPTGSAKSTLMLNQIVADMRSGRSVVVIDPKTDLVMDVLARIPKGREDEVVVLDPTHQQPVGLNFFSSPRSPELIADSILTVVRDLFPTMFGPRTSDVLHSALLTLTAAPGATLDQLPRLLTEPGFRSRILQQVNDLHVRSFWQSFDAMSEHQQAQFVGPVLSRLRQFLLRPQLRRVVGQAQPRFDLRDLLSKPRILLVPLNTGLIGGEASKLLGSLLVSALWSLALSRASTPVERRHNVAIYIDEAQEFLRLGGELPDALSRSRSLGFAWTLAHQYRDQFSNEVRAAIDANARSKVAFALPVADAKAMAAMAPTLEAEDFMALPRFHFYAQLVQNGRPGSWISGRSLPAPPATGDAEAIIVRSQHNYGALPTNEDEAALDDTADTFGRSPRHD